MRQHRYKNHCQFTSWNILNLPNFSYEKKNTYVYLLLIIIVLLIIISNILLVMKKVFYKICTRFFIVVSKNCFPFRFKILWFETKKKYSCDKTHFLGLDSLFPKFSQFFLANQKYLFDILATWQRTRQWQFLDIL